MNGNRIILCLIYILSVSSLLFSQQSTGIDDFSNIYAKSIAFKNQIIIENLSMTKQDLLGYSSEGGFAEIYRDHERIVLVNAWFYSEMGKVEYNYYYLDEKTIYLAKELWKYKEPLTTEGAERSIKEYLTINNETFLKTNSGFQKIDKSNIDIKQILDL